MPWIFSEVAEGFDQLLEKLFFVPVQFALLLASRKIIPQCFHLRQSHADIESHWNPFKPRRMQTDQSVRMLDPFSDWPRICPASSGNGRKWLAATPARAAPDKSSRSKMLERENT